MLTLEAIIGTTRHMTAFGERGTGGALDHLPARVEGRRGQRRTGLQAVAIDDEPGWSWDEDQQTWVRV